MNTDLRSKKEISDLILKVLTDQATPGECEQLEHWVKNSEDNRLFFLRFRDSWLASAQAAEADRRATESALESVNRKIAGSSSGHQKSVLELHPGRKRSPVVYAKTAALWILLFGLGAVFSMIFLKQRPIFKAGSAVSVTAPRGSKAKTVLPDGTIVWLNAGSSIEYSLPEKEPARKVSLKGEAFFSVSHDPGHPFTVTAGDLVIKAYGTKFNVKAYPEEKQVETTLLEGSVSVEIIDKGTGSTMLKPNEQAVWYKPAAERSENLMVTRDIDPGLYTMWLNDRLQIRNESLEKLAVLLERKYDVTIHFDNSRLRDLRFTGIIENETIEQVLELLKISSKVDYRINNREIWLSGTGR